MLEKNEKLEETFKKKIRLNLATLVCYCFWLLASLFILSEGNMTLLIIVAIILALSSGQIIKSEFELLEGCSLSLMQNEILEATQSLYKSEKSNEELVKIIQEKCIEKIQNIYEFNRDNETYLSDTVNVSLPYISSVIDNFVLMYIMILESDKSFRKGSFRHKDSIKICANALVVKIFESFEYGGNYWTLLPQSNDYLRKI